MTHPFPQTLKAYQTHLLTRNYSPRSIRRYTLDLLDFFNYLKEKKIQRLQDLKRETLQGYLHHVVSSKRKKDQKPLSQWTKSGRIVALKTFFKYLLKKGDILYNPACEIEAPKVHPRQIREVLKEKEISKVLDSIETKTPLGLRDRAMLELFYSTGIRNTELRFLKIDDIDFKEKEVRILQGKGRFGQRQRLLPLGKVAGFFLEAYLAHSRPKLLKGEDPGFLFLNKEGKQTSILLPNLRFKAQAKQAGLKKSVFTHQIRHSFATHLLRQGADIRFVQEMLGHESLDSTQIYTQVDISDLKKIHKRTHPRERA